MTDFPNIINTEIIDTESDIFWHHPMAAPGDAQHGQVLIFSGIYEENSPEHTQLGKILGACKLTDKEYHTIQFAENEKRAWHMLKEEYQPKVVVLFGVHPVQLGVSALFRLNDLNNFDSVKWIPTLSLQKLEQEPQAKKDLWVNALKPLFADNQ